MAPVDSSPHRWNERIEKQAELIVQRLQEEGSMSYHEAFNFGLQFETAADAVPEGDDDGLCILAEVWYQKARRMYF